MLSRHIVDPDQIPHSAASDRGPHCSQWPVPILRVITVSRKKNWGLKKNALFRAVKQDPKLACFCRVMEFRL